MGVSMLWMEFSSIDERAVLVNVDSIQFIRASSAQRTDVVFAGGHEMEVQGSYDEILKRLQELPGSVVPPHPS